MNEMNGLKILQKVSNVDDDLVLEAEDAFHNNVKKASAKRWIIIAACLCLVILCSVPVLAAAGNNHAYEILYAILPQIAQRLKPINASCIDNGIEMTVVAAEIDGDTATVLVSIHDTTDSRIDMTTDLFDSYRIYTPYNQSADCSLIKYDACTNTATFMLTIEQMDDILIPGDKITLGVSQVLYGKMHSVYCITQIEIKNIPIITDYVYNPDIRDNSGSNDIKFMVPDDTNATALEHGVTLTGIGLIDDELHVQVRYDDILKRDNHGDIFLKDKNGEILICHANNSFWDDSHTNSYEEYVFAISTDNAFEYEIWGGFWTCDNDPIEGDWQVTIALQSQ